MTSGRDRSPAGPSSPAEVFNTEPASSSSWDALSLIPVAAFVFALLAWIATAALGYQSESKGIGAATIAMFPSGFGITGLIVRGQERARDRPRLGRLLGLSFAGGAGAMFLFIVFMGAIWPAL